MVQAPPPKKKKKKEEKAKVGRCVFLFYPAYDELFVKQMNKHLLLAGEETSREGAPWWTFHLQLLKRDANPLE